MPACPALCLSRFRAAVTAHCRLPLPRFATPCRMNAAGHLFTGADAPLLPHRLQRARGCAHTCLLLRAASLRRAHTIRTHTALRYTFTTRPFTTHFATLPHTARTPFVPATYVRLILPLTTPDRPLDNTDSKLQIEDYNITHSQPLHCRTLPFTTLPTTRLSPSRTPPALQLVRCAALVRCAFG